MQSSHFRLAKDQAVSLRKMVRDARAEETQAQNATSEPQGRLIVVAGAKGGVGATTLAVRLAESLSRHSSTVLIDANLRQADLAHVAQASIDGKYDLADVLAGVCRTEDAFVSLRENLSLLPGAWAPGSQPDATSESVGRWLEELRKLVGQGASVVLDAGVGMKPWTEPLWLAASQIVLVTTPNRVAVLDAYATTKLARGEGVTTPIQLLVNRVVDEQQAMQVHTRFSSTCQKFLGESLELMGWAPDYAAFAEVAEHETTLDITNGWLQPLLCGVESNC